MHPPLVLDVGDEDRLREDSSGLLEARVLPRPRLRDLVLGVERGTGRIRFESIEGREVREGRFDGASGGSAGERRWWHVRETDG